MTKISPLILLLLGSIFALVFAYISQFVFDFQPCILCLYQRWPFFALATLTSLGITFFKSKKAQKILLFCCIVLLLINCGLAFYHVGVEQKIFTGPTTCSLKELNNFDNLEDLKNALMKTKAIRCDQPSFVFLGLSMAAWNFFYCLFLALSAHLLHRKTHFDVLREAR